MRLKTLGQTLRWVAAVGLFPILGQAQTDAQVDEALVALRSELAELRRDYGERVTELEARLARIEARVATPVAAPAPTPIPPAPRGSSSIAAANAFNPAVGLILDAKWREFSNGGLEDAIPGFPAGEESGAGDEGLSLGESELNLYANIDTRFYGGTTLAFVDEEGESGVEIEEAYLETLALPAGLAVKAGRMFSSIGYLNILHTHADDFVDRPLPYRAMLDGQFADDGVQLRWVAPTPLFFEVGGELLRGEGFPIAGAADAGKGAWTAFAHLGGDVGSSHSWRAGISLLSGEVEGRETGAATFSGETDMEILDFIWKWAPNGNPTVRNFKIQGEYLRRRERGLLDEAGSIGSLDVDQDGWYVQGVYQFRRQWRVGLRWSELSADDPGSLLAGTVYDPMGFEPRHYSAMLDWSSSEFGRLRLQYNRDSSRSESEDQWLLQYTMSVGAHGAHRF